MCIGNLFTIFGSLFYVLAPWFELPQIEVLIGLGCAVSWISCVRYFALSRSYSIITRTLEVAVPMNIKITAGIAPIFIGYVLLAMSIFWNDTDHFNQFSNASYAFFCMMNGDSILNTFGTVTSKNYWLGQLMCYSFVFMSICVWQNMNLVIVEDSYLNVKYKTGYSWLTDGDDDDQPPPNQATSPQGIFRAGLFGSVVGPGGPPPPGFNYGGNEYPKGLNFPLDASQTFHMNVSGAMPALYNP